MKKILFVMPKFAPGGAEKSLLMLLHLLAEEKSISVDLLFFKKEGIFLDQLPQGIHVLETESTLKTMYSGFNVKNIKGFKGLVLSAARPIATAVCSVAGKNYNHRNQLRWRYAYRHLIDELPGTYDYACGYLDGEALYYVVDKVNAKVKYGWNQNDYKGIGAVAEIDAGYYEKLDAIITLSDECHGILKEVFPRFQQKMRQIPPIVTAGYIRKCAEAFIPQEYEDDGCYRLVSVGRLVEQKGFDMAIKAAAILKERGVRFKWYIIGNGGLYSDLQQQISDGGLNEYVYLLGEKGNPYPYIKHADVFVQPSRFEGKSVILNETKMLAKPILATGYPTVRDQITDGMDGVIVEMEPQAIAVGLEALLTDKEKQETLANNLKAADLQSASVEAAYRELFGLRKKDE